MTFPAVANVAPEQAESTHFIKKYTTEHPEWLLKKVAGLFYGYDFTVLKTGLMAFTNIPGNV